jgi:hypothetical protein
MTKQEKFELAARLTAHEMLLGELMLVLSRTGTMNALHYRLVQMRVQGRR